MNTRSLVVALLVVAVVATPALSKELFNRKAHPATWMKQQRADGASAVKFTVALKQRNLDLLHEAFEAISTPGSPFYRQFMTTEEVQRLVAPLPAHKSAVMSWLKAAGVTGDSIRDLGDAVQVRTTVAVAEELFSTEMYMFRHRVTGARIARQYGSMTLPPSVADAVDLVEGLSGFPVPRESLKPTNTLEGAETITGTPAIVPQTVQASYGSPTSSSPTGNAGISVIEFEGQSFAPADLSDWSTQTGISIAALPAARIIGPNDPTNSGTEATLDIDYTATVAKDQTQWFILYGGSAWLYTFTSEFNAMTSFPYTISISYGWSEADQCEDGIGGTECQQLGVDSFGFVARVNAEFQKIGVRGTSVFVASGDSGANGRTDPDCTEQQLFPAFPGASPWVTTVGATQLNNPVGLTTTAPVCNNGQWGCLAGGQEVAVSYAVASFASGGGFSNVAPTPSYQKTVVENYLKTNKALPPAGYFNTSGRGMPDVAAFGTAILIDQGLSVQSVGGTSASTPIWAAISSMLNSEAIAIDGKPLGFMNPLLYQIFAEQPTAFTDITIGDNICTEDGCASTCTGFTCQAGWDPVTGLGSPVYPELVKYVKSMLTRL